MPHDDPFQSLLAGARANARWAWEALYRAHAPRVLGYLRSQDAPTADDLLGEVFVQVVRDLHTFTGDEDAFRGWLFRIAERRLIDARRRSAARPESPAADLPDRPAAAEPDSVELAIANEADRRVYRALRALPPDQRAVIYLRFVLDLPLEQVAGTLGRSVGAVKMLQRRGLDTLGSRLAPAVAPPRKESGFVRAARWLPLPGRAPPS